MVDGRIRHSLDARLARIEGQIRGIRGMSANGRACVDIVTQIAAARAALKTVADLVVADHVEQWLERVGSSDDGDHAEDVADILKVFNQYYR
jgi:DNA-binding FrmR family transcriptional regulator